MIKLAPGSRNTLRLISLFNPLGTKDPNLKIQDFSFLSKNVSKSPLRFVNFRAKNPFTLSPLGCPLWYSARCNLIGFSSYKFKLFMDSPTLMRNWCLVLPTYSLSQGHSKMYSTRLLAQLINCLSIYVVFIHATRAGEHPRTIKIPTHCTVTTWVHPL